MGLSDTPEISSFTRLRLERALYQQEIADHLGIKRQTLTKWEHGFVQPALRHRRKLAEILDITMQELLELFPPRPRRSRSDSSAA